MPTNCRRIVQTLQAGDRVFARVVLVEGEGGERAILKDFGCSPWLFRSTLGAILACWEARAYKRLEGVSGVPRLITRVGAHGLLIQYLAGTNCLRAPESDFSQDFFDQASVLLSAVRARGVLHFDVGGNLILGLDGKPRLVDFGSCVLLPRRLGRIGRSLAELRAKYDERALLKLKKRRVPRLLTGSEAEKARAILPFESWVRIVERLLKRTLAWISVGSRLP